MIKSKKMSRDRIRREEEKLDEMLLNKLGNDDCVLDGIVNIDCYVKSNPRLLWILKEPNDKGNLDPCLRNYLRNMDIDDANWKPTYRRVIEVSYGIIHSGKLSKRRISATPLDHKIQIIQEIAVINVNKRRGGSSISWKKLEEVFEELQEEIFKQIDYINPEVIIGGGTLGLFYNKLKIDVTGAKKGKWLHHSFEKNGRLWLKTYHPQYPKAKSQHYYRAIIDRFKNWKSRQVSASLKI